MSLLLGEFNIPGGDAKVNYEFQTAADASTGAGQHRRRWARTWTSHTEVTDGGPTHFTMASGVSARLNRTLASLPGWAAYGLAIRMATTTSGSATIHRWWSSACRRAACWHAGQRPIAREVVQDPRFPQLLQRTLEFWGVGQWGVIDRF